ncbi:hypothetical protein HGQ17_00300 [Nesterenkonia sp. MY13]|uniref:Uncharacterized protein n=2 Tax=Nesterenkonia sedimenti TaxID=1463632 RepID=A0A7X8YCM6_9MICC|nr:hypothetical protein [Nesterenkonia sedimenti]
MAWQGLRMWTPRQIMAAVLSSVGVALLIGIATVLIPNPLFARDIPPVWWNYPIWILTAVLSGMLVATYVRPYSAAQTPTVEAPSASGAEDAVLGKNEKRSSRLGMVGTFLAWFAVGCPVCNKIALLALGYSGAITYFTPVQPFLAAAAVIFCGVALVLRLKGQVACPTPRVAAKNVQAHESAGV